MCGMSCPATARTSVPRYGGAALGQRWESLYRRGVAPAAARPQSAKSPLHHAGVSYGGRSAFRTRSLPGQADPHRAGNRRCCGLSLDPSSGRSTGCTGSPNSEQFAARDFPIQRRRPSLRLYLSVGGTQTVTGRRVWQSGECYGSNAVARYGTSPRATANRRAPVVMETRQPVCAGCAHAIRNSIYVQRNSSIWSNGLTAVAPSSSGSKPIRMNPKALLALSTFVSFQSHGMPLSVDIKGPAAPFFDAGKAFFMRAPRPT